MDRGKAGLTVFLSITSVSLSMPFEYLYKQVAAYCHHKKIYPPSPAPNKYRLGLTVFFEGPFWVGVFERVEDGKLSVCRVVLGSGLNYQHFQLLEKAPAIPG